MKKLIALLIILMAIFIAGCVTTAIEDESNENEQLYLSEGNNDVSTDMIAEVPTVADIAATSYVSSSAESYSDDYMYSGGWGGMGHECERHSHIFHDRSIFLGAGGEDPVIDSEVARLWALPLIELEEETGECLRNIFSFIQHFNIPREGFQGLIDGNPWWYFQYGGDTLDILYSGDWALVDQFFAHEIYGGRAEREAFERETRWWNEKMKATQEIINMNTNEMSRYFHDIWSWSYFSNDRGWYYDLWMGELIDAGEYGEINIVEFIHRFDLGREHSRFPGLTIFEHWAIHDNLNIFTHFNFDILLSGDWDLILSYYSIENEPLHTAAVQQRFNNHVSQHGMPDTSWMLPAPPPAESLSITTTAVYVGAVTQLSATLNPTNARQRIDWTVTSHNGVTISQNGVLTIASDVPVGTVITATATAIPANISDTTEITVTVPVESVIINAPTALTLPGNRLQFSATVYPPEAFQTVIWAVEGHAGVTISEIGQLTVPTTVPIGTTLTITATATGTEIYDTATLQITSLPGDENGDKIWWGFSGRLQPATNNETTAEYLLQLIFTINQLTFRLNGETRTAVGAPFLEGARTMVPLRTIAESTGAGVEWCDDTQAAIIHLYRSPMFTTGQRMLTIPISEPLPNNMGSVMLINARTFVPLRFIMEAMDADVEWLEDTEQAVITWY